MKNKHFLMICVGLAVISCGKEVGPIEPEPSVSAPVFTAVLEDTKTSLNGSQVSWCAGDRISVNGATYSASIDSETGEVSFNIEEGTAPTPIYKAYYPFSLYQDGRLSLPSDFAYEEGKFNMPLYAESETTTLEFEHLCGFFAITVNNVNGPAQLASITISSDTKATSGEFGIGSVDGKHFAQLSTPEAISQTVTLNCNDAVLTADGTVFYIPVPVQTYRGIRIWVRGSEGESLYMVTGNMDIAIERNTIYRIGFRSNFTPATANLTHSDGATDSADERH